MSKLPDHLRIATDPVAPSASVVQGEKVRFTMLTAQLVRCEYSPDGVFEDRATQTVLNRNLPTPEFRVQRSGSGDDEHIQVITPWLHLDYSGGPFTPSSLKVQQMEGGYHSVWRPGQEADSKFAQYVGYRTQLGGTARTLDAVDGAIELEPGLVNELGIVGMDDSHTLALVDGWVEQRHEGNVDTYVFAHGHDYAAAVRDFYLLTGRQPVLPRWALGNWWSRYHDYSQDEYMQLVERFESERLPFSVAVVDMDWHLVDIDKKYGAGWTGYTWNDELFPDHVAFLEWLHQHDLKVSLNVHPAEGVRGFEKAYPAVARAMGMDPADHLPVVFDITDPTFINAYLDQLHHPLEQEGVDFWWIDWQQGGNSRIAELDPLWMLNHLHFLDSGRDGRRPMTFSRYAGPGSHRYPIGFSGDTVVSWDSLAFQPFFTSTASNIGYGWWSHDIGGHMFGVRDDELATRWVQFGVFSPINRLHASNGIFNGKEPWRFNAHAEKVMGDFLRLRHRMLPWLFTENVVSSAELRPLVRPMYWTAPDEVKAYQVLNQYWFGRDVIVNPITTPAIKGVVAGKVDTWLPEGQWTDLFTGLSYSGGRMMTMYRPLETIPVLAHAGSIIPLQGGDELGTAHPTQLELRVVAGADGSYELVEDDDRAEPSSVTTRFDYHQSDGTVTIDPAQGELSLVPATRHYRLVLVGAGTERAVELDVVTAEGATATFEGSREPDNRVAERVLVFLDRAQMPHLDKERALAVVQGTEDAARRIAELTQLGLDEDVLGALREMVLALA